MGPYKIAPIGWYGIDDWHADDGGKGKIDALSTEKDYEETGLLGASGDPIVRQIRWPAGFIRFPMPAQENLR